MYQETLTLNSDIQNLNSRRNNASGVLWHPMGLFSPGPVDCETRPELILGLGARACIGKGYLFITLTRSFSKEVMLKSNFLGEWRSYRQTAHI